MIVTHILHLIETMNYLTMYDNVLVIPVNDTTYCVYSDNTMILINHSR